MKQMKAHPAWQAACMGCAPQAEETLEMRQRSHYQPLTYDIRLPDEMQADALWLLEESRRVINATLVALWPYLDDFIEEDTGPAWQQVGQFISSPFPHGDRQWRCESETAGCIMRALSAVY